MRIVSYILLAAVIILSLSLLVFKHINRRLFRILTIVDIFCVFASISIFTLQALLFREKLLSLAFWAIFGVTMFLLGISNAPAESKEGGK